MKSEEILKELIKFGIVTNISRREVHKSLLDFSRKYDLYLYGLNTFFEEEKEVLALVYIKEDNLYPNTNVSSIAICFSEEDIRLALSRRKKYIPNLIV